MNLRKVIVKNTRYRYVTITQSENRFVVRVLSPILDTQNIDKNADQLLGVDMLNGKCFSVNGRNFKVVAECIFDKRIDPRWWVAGTSIAFYISPYGIGSNLVSFAPLDGLIELTKETKNRWHDRHGNVILAMLNCKDAKDTIIETDKQIRVDLGGFLLTNIPQSGDGINVTDVNDKFNYLWGFNYNVVVPKEVKPNHSFEVELHVDLNNNTNVNGEFVIEEISGYFPKKRVKVSNGVGRFTGIALGLTEGDEIEFGVGNDYNPHIVRATIKVIE